MVKMGFIQRKSPTMPLGAFRMLRHKHIHLMRFGSSFAILFTTYSMKAIYKPYQIGHSWNNYKPSQVPTKPFGGSFPIAKSIRNSDMGQAKFL